MAHQLLNKLKFLKSQWLWGSILGVVLIVLIGGYASYVYWISQLDEKDLREEHREWAIGLLFPAVVGFGGFWLNQQSEKRTQQEQEQDKIEAKNERDLREKLAKDERDEQREQNDLKYYFDRISTLVIENGLTKSDEKSEQYQIARALTANILRELTEERMNQVMCFLSSLSLLGQPIETEEESLESENEQLKRSLSLLRGIDLNNAELQGLNGAWIDLSEAKLRGADLSGADLSGADLIKANLSEAKLSDAHLIKANLIKANLSEAKLRGADLSGANLREAALIDANLIDAILIKADLSDAHLWRANLSDAILIDAILIKANLSGANLSDAHLWRANLSDAILIDAILIDAILIDAILIKANLSDAHLSDADFREATLKRTKLSAHLSEKQQKQCEIYDPIIVESEG